MLNKKLLISLFVVFVIAPYEDAYAHGAGGGDASYAFDKKDNTADREAKKKAAEKQSADENWGDFMKEIKRQEQEANADKASKK